MLGPVRALARAHGATRACEKTKSCTGKRTRVTPRVRPLCSFSFLFLYTTSDLSCKKWHLGQRSTALHSVAHWKGQLSLKECVGPATALWAWGRKREEFLWIAGPLQFAWINYTVDSCFVSSRRGPSPELLSSVLNCSVDAVISSVHGQITVCSILSGGGLQDGEREGRRRLCSDLLLHKEDYLFINVSIWTFAIFGCLSSLTHCKSYEI